MAENESLDVRVSRRWVSFMKALYSGDAMDLASDLFFRTLIGGWKQAQKQLGRYGTSLEEVCEKALNHENLDALFHRTWRHDYVKLFEIERRPFDSADSLMERVVSASAERVLDQIRHDAIGTGFCPNVGAWNTLKQQLMKPIAGQIARFAAKLAAGPSVPIRLPARASADRSGPPGGSFVHLSLLNQLPQVSVGARV